MLDLNDQRWKELDGGYRIPFDVSVPLIKLENNVEDSESIWSELWENLYHQRDVGVASYAAIPHIVRITRNQKLLDWNPFALTVAIELVRGTGRNPELPDWLRGDYTQALRNMAAYACEQMNQDWDASFLRSALSLIAIVKGNRDLAELIFGIDEGEERKALEIYFDS